MKDVPARNAAFPSLPVELWNQIVNISSYSACLSIGSVSRLHHALALPMILESLNLTVPRVTIGHGESDSDLEAKRFQEYLRLDDFLKNVAEGGIPILRSLRRLSVLPLVEDPVWAFVDGKRVAEFHRWSR